MKAANTDIKLTLYHYNSCPYCAYVRREIDKLGVDVEFRDIQKNASFRQELLQGGGKTQVPCLKIGIEGQDPVWLYESLAIAGFLSKVKTPDNQAA